MLHWVDSKVPNTSTYVNTSQFFVSAHAWFEGEVLDLEQDMTDALNYLVAEGLLEGMEAAEFVAPHHVRITHAGQKCVTDFDADVAAYLAAGQGEQPKIIQVVNAEPGSAIAISLGDGSPATATSAYVHLEAAVTLAQAVREALPVLKLEDDPTEALEDLKQSDDPGRVKRGLRWFGRFANDSTAGAIGNVLGAAALAILHNLG
jgi:hypothetical protein